MERGCVDVRVRRHEGEALLWFGRDIGFASATETGATKSHDRRMYRGVHVYVKLKLTSIDCLCFEILEAVVEQVWHGNVTKP